MSFVRTLSIFVFASFASSAYAEGNVLTLDLSLKTDALMQTPTVHLGDVLANDVGASQWRALSNLAISKAPRIDAVIQLDRADIERSLKVRYPDLHIRWSGAEKVKLRTKPAVLDTAQLAEKVISSVHRQLAPDFSELDVRIEQSPKDIAVPYGDVDFSIRPLSAPLFARMPVWVDIKVNGDVYRSIVVVVSLSSMQEVLVASENLQEGSALSRTAFRPELKNVVGLLKPISAHENEVGDIRLRKPLRRGQVLSKEAIYPDGTVLYGEQVKLKHDEGAISLEVRAVAERQAKVGEMIKVRPVNGAESVVGMLVAPGIVKVVDK